MVTGLFADGESKKGLPAVKMARPDFLHSDKNTPHSVGPYRIIRRLGYGSRGDVFLGERVDGQVSMKAAIKLVRQDIASEFMQANLCRERQPLADLKHPNIAMLLDAGTTEDGLPYVIMEYVEGQPIDEWCREQKLHPVELLRLFARLVSAVAFAHERGIVHRDINSVNILITGNHEPKLLDFGIAEPAGRDPQQPGAMSPEYAAPEQLLGAAARATADIYALGILLLQLLTETRPRDWQESPYDRITRSFVLSPMTAPAPPESLIWLLRKSLAENPGNRYQTVNELKRDLENTIATMALATPAGRPDQTHDVVIWSHPAAQELVKRLQAGLEDHGISVLNPHQTATRSSAPFSPSDLTRARCCMVCLGSFEEKPWSFYPLVHEALCRNVQTELIAVLLPGGLFPEKQSELPPYLRLKVWHIPDFSLPGSLDDLAILIRGEQQQSGTRSVDVCPFRGLEAFREQDSPFFFGREPLIQQLGQALEINGFTAILGASGSGKSSLVQAGLLPVLRRNNFEPIMFTPGTNPCNELAHMLSKMYAQMQHPWSIPDLRQRLCNTDESLQYILRELIEDGPWTRMVLVIDQFEELFTLGDPKEVSVFLRLLCNLLAGNPHYAAVILTMRSDFIGHCAAYPDLNAYICEHMIQVGPMNREELFRAIMEPAHLVGLRFEEGLIDHILADVQGAIAELPLLEHALLELYRHRSDDLLRLSTYRKIGGIEGALTRRADWEYEKMSEKEQLALRKMFVLCLVHPGEGAEDTRRRATLDELRAICGTAVDTESLVHRLTSARLLTTWQDELRELEMVDVAHEALIRKWDKISEWMAEDRESARQIQRLRRLAEAWEEAGRDVDHLPRGGPLQQLEDLTRREGKHLGDLERAFIEAGLKERDRQEQAIEVARMAELEATRRQTRRSLLVAAVFVVLVSVFASFMWVQQREANQQKQSAEQITHFLSRMLEGMKPAEHGSSKIDVEQILDIGSTQLDQAEMTSMARAGLAHTLGRVYRSLSRYDKAQPLLEEALSFYEQHLGETHHQTAASLYDLSWVLYLMGEFDASERYLKRSLKIRLTLFGEQHPAVVACFSGLASNHQERDRFKEAEILFQKVLTINRKLYGEHHEEVASALNSLAYLFQRQGRFAEAGSMIEEALAINREIYGDDHAEVAKTLSNLAGLKKAQGHPLETEPLLREALAIQRRVFGDEHAAVAMGLENLSNILQIKGEYTESEPMLREAAAIHRKIYGSQHPALARVLNDLGVLLYCRENQTGAELLVQESLAIYRKVHGARHTEIANSLSNLGRILQGSGRHEEAAKYLNEALAIEKQASGEQHYKVGVRLVYLADIENDLASHLDAEQHVRNALAIYKTSLPAGHWRIDEARSVLGAALAGQGGFLQARPLLISSYRNLVTRLHKNNLRARQAAQRIAHFNQTANDHVITLDQEPGRNR